MAKRDEIAIRVSNVSKTFKLPHEKHKSIKSMFVNIFRGSRTYEKQKALNDVSFEVKKGEFFGIVGRNGMGKSTLLKIISGIYTPDTGHIEINGKLTPFIELGVGFNPELTGRENVYLNGALLGFNRKQMTDMYDDIVEFAELGNFMDQKLKNYSSGMQVRLAFSIAVRANTDILVLDEVLAVGDSNFQRKCLDYFRRFKEEGRTIILVTHSMEQIEKFCDRALLVSNGSVIKQGSPKDVAFAYTRQNSEIGETKLKTNESGNKKLVLKDVKAVISGKTLRPGGRLEITANYKQNNPAVSSFFVAAGIYNEDGAYVIGVDMKTDGISPIKVKKTGKVSIVFEKLPLLTGEYKINIAAYELDRESPLHFLREVAGFRVLDPDSQRGLVSVKHKWSFDE